MRDVPYSFVEDLFAQLEKSAAENDSLRARLEASASRPVAPTQAADQPAVFSAPLLEKLAAALEAGEYFPPGITTDKVAAAFQLEPDRLLQLALNAISPFQPDGAPFKSAGVTPLPDTVRFDGREFVDPYGFVNVLT